MSRWADTKAGAQKSIQDELRKRFGPRAELVGPHARFYEAADIWMAKIVDRREDTTADIYRHWLHKLVLPELGDLQLYECDVPHIDAFFSRLERARRTIRNEDGTKSEKIRYAPNTRRTIRSIVSGILQQAVLHGAIASNPVRELERIEAPKGQRKSPPRGLTPEERRRLFRVVEADPIAVRADLPDLIRTALGSGLRIGELCATRILDLNLEGIPVVSPHDMRLVPVIAVRQNVYPVKGKGLVVHEGKTPSALRIVPLPEFVTNLLRARLTGDENPEWPVFDVQHSRPLMLNNSRTGESRRCLASTL